MYWKNVKTTKKSHCVVAHRVHNKFKWFMNGFSSGTLCSKKQSSNALVTDRHSAYYSGFVSQKDKMQIYNIIRTLEIA